MHRTFALVVLGLILAAVPAAEAAKPRSFALWTASWKAHSDKLVNAAADPCQKAFPRDDLKLGECFVHRLISTLQSASPEWEHQVAAVARSQTQPCKAAIHRYWLASRKLQAAEVIYLKAHPHTKLTQVNADFADEPYATLGSVTDETKSRAIRVCG
jgi:hypothetical protein